MEKKLIPIFITNEDYPYGGANAISGTVNKSNFISSGRLTPTCKYTQFTGPTNESPNYAVTLYPGNEVIFASLPNYTYRIKFKVQGFMKFWRYTRSVNLAYQVYDKNGDLAEYANCEGCRFFNFKAFPIVVELSKQGKVELEVEAYKKLTANDPFAKGNFCINGIPAYSNTTSPDGLKLLRIVDPKYRIFNDSLRQEYFSVSSGPCLSMTNKRYTLAQTQTLTISLPYTLTENSAKYGELYINQCWYYFWLNFLSSTGLFDTSSTGFYLYCNTSGDYTIDFRILLLFPDLFYSRCNLRPALVMFEYASSLVVFDTIGDQTETGYVFEARSKKVTLESDKYYYFAIVNFVHTTTPDGVTLSLPTEIIGETITLSL